MQYQESTDNSSWDAWNGLATVSATAGYGTLSVAPSSTRGNYRRFQVRTLGAVGGSYCIPWKVSTNSVRRYLLSTLSLDKQTLNAGETITAAIGIGQNSYTHKLTFAFGSRTQVQVLAAGVSSYAFTVPSEWLSQIPTSFSGVAACTMETYSDSTVIDTKSKTFTVVCPDSVVPVIGSMSLSPVSGVVPPAWNLYVKPSMILMSLLRNGTYSYPISAVMEAGFNGIASATGTLPAILPTDTLSVYFGAQADYPAEYRIEWIKLEYGAVATPEYPRSLGEELLLCQRFYYTVPPNGLNVLARTYNLSSSPYSAAIFAPRMHFPVSMRVTPTVVVKYDINGGVEVSGSPWITDKYGFQQVDVGIPAGQYYTLRSFTADAEIY